MTQNIVDKGKTCKPGSLGSVLFDTLTRWQKKVPREDEKRGTDRFVNWTNTMQGKGMFGGCESVPPKLRDFSVFSKQATGSRNQATAKLQEAGLLQRARAEKDEKKAVTFLADCQCFLEELKFSIQTQSSAQLPQQVPDTTSSSPGTHPGR